MRPKRDAGQKLGELLEARGRLDRETLFRAMRQQRAAGGRIGTCLLELDLVQEDELLHVLAEQSKLPFVEPEAMRAIPPETIQLVPAKVARTRRAIPVRSSGTYLYVAMLDPHDIAAQDELAFVSSRRVRPQVASEVRIYEALARYYAVDIPGRFVKLIDRLNRARYLWKNEGEAAAAPQPPGAKPGPPPPPELRPPPPPPPTPPPSAATAPPASHAIEPPVAPPPAAAPAPPVAPPPAVNPPVAEPPSPPAPPPAAPEPPAAITLEQAEARLIEPASRDEIAEVVVDFARTRADGVLLLMVRRGEAAGWRAALPAASDERVRAFRLSLAQPSIVLALREGVPFYRGPLPPLKAHEGLRALLGPLAAGEQVALPVRVRQRLVAVLMAASGSGPFQVAALDDLKRVAERASVALEMLVLRQKLQHT